MADCMSTEECWDGTGQARTPNFALGGGRGGADPAVMYNLCSILQINHVVSIAVM